MHNAWDSFSIGCCHDSPSGIDCAHGRYSTDAACPPVEPLLILTTLGTDLALVEHHFLPHHPDHTYIVAENGSHGTESAAFMNWLAASPHAGGEGKHPHEINTELFEHEAEDHHD